MANNYPIVYLTSDVLSRLNAYYRHCTTGEISGLGHAVEYEGDVLIDDVVLLPQESSAAETELKAEDLGRWITQLIREGKEPSEWRFWWHKHPINNWSGTDDDNIEHSLNNGEWTVSLVHTPNGLLARMDLYKPFRVTMDALTIREVRNTPVGFDEAIKAEIAEKVKPKSLGTGYTYQHGLYDEDAYGEAYAYKYAGLGTGTTSPQLPPPTKKNTNSQSPNGNGGGRSIAEIDDREQFWLELLDSAWEENFHWEETYRVMPKVKEAE